MRFVALVSQQITTSRQKTIILYLIRCSCFFFVNWTISSCLPYRQLCLVFRCEKQKRHQRKMSSNLAGLAGAFSQTKVTKRKRRRKQAEPIGVFDDLGDCCLTSGALEEISGNKAFLRCQNRTPPPSHPYSLQIPAPLTD